MSRKDVLSLFVSLTLRRHSRCPFRLQAVSRRASTSNSPATEKVRVDIKKPTIPLHVGLDRNPENLSAISRIPIPRGVTGEKFTPSVLARPLGLEHPPRPGENSPIDNRTLRERHEEFTSYEKALERRRIYLRTFFRPYFQEWRRVDHFKGKSFVSNPRLFKREKALYFPNIWGQTLAAEGDGPQGGRDTTPVLMGKVSVIAMQSGHWAEEQVDTFVSVKSNPELNKMIEESNGHLQRVDINLQGDWIRALLVKMFSGRLRKTIPEERWGKYFMIKLPRDIRRGLNDETRDAIGLLNSQVGYVYLVDSSCKIRWAGSGHAWEGEVQGLNAAVQRLLQEEENLGQTSSQPISHRSKSVTPKSRVPTPEMDKSRATPNKRNAIPTAITA
ncbi:uncharacterized protein Z520_08747 [Fonsecaea multimorphosa CBS 102226]|uniref:Mitochondrial ATPase complex subunit ATP10 n=1 Tax=Fonsecaea multimorphosa CBS 102226 TaxID=1442371 RepID=A0A0D2JQJ5_9EURO|nr:uncharacterized protein Z520_08747 [Fonsecaea multimorphosa CBS 102226]KIX95627.1 hypothetical protein Z520_08747 [Fonsecaea multimorphosa CBS 102226]OAL21232.1 hypothetical protein AYO22_08195 [Fonsecaea multimorphosa]